MTSENYLVYGQGAITHETALIYSQLYKRFPLQCLSKHYFKHFLCWTPYMRALSLPGKCSTTELNPQVLFKSITLNIYNNEDFEIEL